MKMHPTRQPPNRREGPPPAEGLVPLDTHAIRHKSLQDYRKAEQNLDTLKSQLKRFREEDTPGFRAWLHQTFGSLLTRQRELTQALQGKRALLLEVEKLADRLDLSDVAAYRIAQWRRAHPEEAQAQDLEFEEELRRRQAKRNERSGKPPGAGDHDPKQDDHANDDLHDLFETATGTALRSAKHASQADRPSRDLYRTIVRQLHPDRHGAMSEARKNLWHEAQAAYRRRDVAALHNVLARCDNGEAGLGQHTPVAMIHRLTAQLHQAIQSTQSELLKMKTDPAWNYEERQQDPRYARKIRSELQSAIHSTENNLRSIDEVLAQLEREAHRTQRQSQARQRHPPTALPEDEFLF